jgi:RNA polymerase sigma-70 factor (ECF subfamily)
MNPNEPTDAELAHEVAAGNEAALDTLLNRFVGALYNFAYRLVSNKEDAEDIVQETFVKVWRSIGSYRHSYHFKQWLFTIARNTAIDHLRKRKNLAFSDFENSEGENALIDNLSDPGPLPDEVVAAAETAHMLESLLEKLSPLYREVLILRYHHEFTFEEIAGILKKPVDTVKSQHRRGIIALRALFNDLPHAPKL